MDFCAQDADLIMRCREPEHVDFYVFKRILVEGSAVFRDMLQTPDSASALSKANNPMRVVELVESAEVVDSLLRLLYPMRKPHFESLDELILVIRAADKFQMHGLLYQLREMLVSARFLVDAPVRVYAVACIFSWEAEAKAASQAALSVDVLRCEPFPELGDISARAILRLIQMHQTRGQLAMQLLNNFSPTCTGTPGSACSAAAPLWWLEFKNRAREELRISPTTARIFKACVM
ncbi:hypothetical protein AURDEDRAFT_53221 [Auricularia subglabra TFB-10046 SS5]|nr:hypothetical protein AURDEDRAFT_53221 [Auricularia subglabra TFB-10046 SS5]